MAANAIRSVSFRPIAPDDGSEGGHAMFVELDLGAPDHLPGFLEDVITRFKRERMAGPPDTHFMLITVIGHISANDFAGAWRAATANDAPAHALIGALHRADVIQGDADGHMIGQASLRGT